MTVALISITIAAVLMYFEGALFATLLGSAAQQTKFRTALLVLLWPITLPIAGCLLYKKFSPLINEVRTNPFLKAVIQAQTTGETPTLFQVNNPFEMATTEVTVTEEIVVEKASEPTETKEESN